jgi:Tfp pilus assembly protein PilP
MKRRDRAKGKHKVILSFMALILTGILVLSAPASLRAAGETGTEETGLADPFESFLRTDKDRAAKLRPLEPLELFNIADLKLLGIALSEKKRVAMIEDPAGKLYSVFWGTRIGPNDGQVVGISQTRVVIEETVYGPTGQKEKNRVVMDLYGEKTGGEKP